MNDSHRLGPAEIVGVLRTDVERGLDEEEAGRRLAVLGPNVLPPGRKRSQLVRLLLQFHHPLIYILLGTAAVTAALQEWVDSGVILGVVVVNAIIGFIQEAKAERALESLKDMLAPVAVVLRDGRKAIRPASVARTVAVNAIVSFEVFYLFNTRFLQESVLNRAGLLGNRVALVGVLAVVALQAAFTYWPPMHKLLRSAPLEPMMWARIVAASFVLLLLVEAEKVVSRRLTR